MFAFLNRRHVGLQAMPAHEWHGLEGGNAVLSSDALESIAARTINLTFLSLSTKRWHARIAGRHRHCRHHIYCQHSDTRGFLGWLNSLEGGLSVLSSDELEKIAADRRGALYFFYLTRPCGPHF